MSKNPLHFAIFFNLYCKMLYYLKVFKIKGNKMTLIIKNVESLFEKLESKLETWAKKLF